MSDSLEILQKLITVPDLASKKWVYEQYDSQVMNDTIAINGDAAIVRVHGTNKALAITSDCTPRYVFANPFEGAKQAVAETYRNISATGAKPLAITNCLNFGNPQKPKIMGQIVKAIKGINEACKFLDYPVISGNVSLYNETDGKAIYPTPTIGGVGLLKNLEQRAEAKFTNLDDEIFIIGKTLGHLDSSIYQREILQEQAGNNPPIVDLKQEKANSELVRKLIAGDIVNICHDVSDGGLLVALFEMCSSKIGCEIDLTPLKNATNLSETELFFAEDQSRYVVAVSKDKINEFNDIVANSDVFCCKVAKNVANDIIIEGNSIAVSNLQDLNIDVFQKKFG